MNYIVLLCSIMAVIVQIWCLIFFIRRKNLKNKWIYLIASLIGFPIGIGTVWATGGFVLKFGFNIPAVSISSTINAPEMWSISVFFPIGFVLMQIQKSKDKDQYTLQNIEEKNDKTT